MTEPRPSLVGASCLRFVDPLDDPIEEGRVVLWVGLVVVRPLTVETGEELGLGYYVHNFNVTRSEAARLSLSHASSMAS
jgi:hypothetical protein